MRAGRAMIGRAMALVFTALALLATAPASARIVRTAHFAIELSGRQDPTSLARELESAYAEVRARGLSLPPMIRVRCHGTTTEFTRATGASRYHAAAVRGDLVHLQPVAVLVRSGSIHRSLRHELVHVSLAAAETDGLPRWLNEGLAMAIAGERHSATGRYRGVEQLERTLVRPGSPADLRRAYGVAQRLTDTLVRRHGWRAVLSVIQPDREPGGFHRRFRGLTGLAPAEWADRVLNGGRRRPRD